jgi:ketosteroid isomerase-like protein
MLNRRNAVALPLAALGVLSAGCVTTASENDTAATEVHIIDEFLAAYRSGDMARGMALMAENVYFEDPTMHLLARNREELSVIAQQGADNFTEIRLTPFNRIHASPWTILQLRLAGTILHPDGQGRSVDVQGLTMLEVRDAKIVRWYDYYDALTFRQQTR